MTDSVVARRRARAVLVLLFVAVASAAAGWGIYTRTGKVLGILAFITLGVFLRQATFPNGFMLVALTSQLSFVQFTIVREEFESDKWIALVGMAAISMALPLFSLHHPPWPGLGHLFAASLVLVAAFSPYWSLDPRQSFAKAGAFGLGLTIAFVGVWTWARDVGRIRQLLDRYLDTYWLVFPLGLLMLIVPYGNRYVMGRFQSIYTNPNQLGFWGSLGMPLLLSQALSHPVRWRRRACAVMFACGLLVVTVSGSRGGILGAAIGCGLYLGLRFPFRTLAAVAAVVVVIAFARGYGADFSAVGESVIVRSDTIDDLSDRRIWWEIGLVIAEQRQWTGHGFGIGDSLFAHYLMDFHVETYGPTVHNTYLETYLTLGLLGLGSLIALQCWLGWLGLRTWWRDRDGEVGLLALSLLAGCVATSAHAFVETVLTLVGNPWTVPFFAFLGLLARLARIQKAESRAVAVAPSPAPQPVPAPA